jgi:hypothetical protein
LKNKTIIEMTDALSKTYVLANNSSRISIKKIVYKFEQRRIKIYEKYTIKNYNKTDSKL